MSEYFALHGIQRGKDDSPSKIEAGTVIFPALTDEAEIERLIENGAIREATEEEITFAEAKASRAAKKSGKASKPVEQASDTVVKTMTKAEKKAAEAQAAADALKAKEDAEKAGDLDV